MSSASIELKKQQVNTLVKEFEDSVSCVVVNHRGLSVHEATELRAKLRAEGAEMKVIKNNISRRAVETAGYDGLKDLFVGPSALVFSKEDAVAPARVVYDFAKNHEQLELKGGYVERKILDVDQLSEVAKLPGREGMLSMLLSVLQAPIRNFAYAVKGISELNPEAEASE